jgi:uroporphyrinogen decarboxylase
MNNIKAKEKIKRVRDSIYFENPDKIPVADLFFWDEFIKNWKEYFKLDQDTDIFKYYDLDVVLCTPNIDPIINNVVEIEKTQNYVVYKGGFGSTLKMDFSQPVPYFVENAITDIKDLDKFKFEDPNNNSRYTDGFAPPDQYSKLPSFYEQLNNYKNDFCIFGNICEARETVWRILGLQNELLAIHDSPEILIKFAERVADFNIELGKIQLENESINGLIIYGDVGYSNGLLMSPEAWREIYYPSLKKICIALSKYQKPIIYHTDGNYLEIIEDLLKAGICATHPNEAKAGIDVVQLKQKYHKKLAFLGNIDAVNVLSKDKDSIKKEIHYKLKAAEGGGYLPGGDDVPPSVSPENYDYYIRSIKEYSG